MSLPNAYEAVAALRAHWFRRGGSVPMVAVDNVLAGDLDRLRLISSLDVEAVRYLDLKAAYARFGRLTNSRPVLHVTLARESAK